MLVTNNLINSLRRLKLMRTRSSNKNHSQNSLINFNDPNTREIMDRLSVQFEGIHRAAENNAVKKAITGEFGHEMPFLEKLVIERMFDSRKQQNTIGII